MENVLDLAKMVLIISCVIFFTCNEQYLEQLKFQKEVKKFILVISACMVIFVWGHMIREIVQQVERYPSLVMQREGTRRSDRTANGINCTLLNDFSYDTMLI